MQQIVLSNGCKKSWEQHLHTQDHCGIGFLRKGKFQKVCVNLRIMQGPFFGKVAQDHRSSRPLHAQ